MDPLENTTSGQEKRQSKGSKLEELFADQWKLFGDYLEDIPAPERNYKGLLPRLFKFDFAWPDVKVAVEVEGGSFVKGRHTRGVGYAKDCEKYNLATMNGWAILRYTGAMLKADPLAVLNEIADLIRKRRPMRPIAVVTMGSMPLFSVDENGNMSKRGE